YISSYHFVDLLSRSSSYLLSNRGRQSCYAVVYYFFFSFLLVITCVHSPSLEVLYLGLGAI
ncbi:unnamed protein product, partial [Prunus brigantina]